MIPLVDLAAQYKKIRPEILAKIEELLESRSFIQGEFVAEFENKFTKLHGANFGSGCSNGTSAIQLALEALGVLYEPQIIAMSPQAFSLGGFERVGDQCYAQSWLVRPVKDAGSIVGPGAGFRPVKRIDVAR